MYSKRYYQIQLKTFMKLKEKCTNNMTLKKIDKVISKYQHFIDNYDSMTHRRFGEECHCSLCVMQG